MPWIKRLTIRALCIYQCLQEFEEHTNSSFGINIRGPIDG